MTYLVVGASSGLGRAITVALARIGANLVIVSSDQRDLDALATDCAIRYGVSICPVALSFNASSRPDLSKLEKAIDKTGELNGMLFPIGATWDEDRFPPDETIGIEVLAANFSSVSEIISYFSPKIIKERKGDIVGFGSIAAARGRNANIYYSAAKRALASFFESIRHGFAPYGVMVSFYIVGYLDTGQAFGMSTPIPKASPERIAEKVVNNLGNKGGVWYIPSFWMWISAALKWTPWSIFRRMNF